MNLKEEFPGRECGEAKQGVQLLVWAELGQVQPSLSVVLLCVPWQLFLRLFLNYENTKRKWLPTLVIWAGDGICLARDWPWPWYCGCHLHWAWLPTLCWCGLSVLWQLQCAAKYIQTIKGTEVLCLAVSGEDQPMMVLLCMYWRLGWRRTSWTDRIWLRSYLWLNPQILKHDRQGEGRRY